MDEVWHVIEGYDYRVSNLGRVCNRSGKIMKPQPNANGYLYVSLCRDGVKQSKGIHVLVARSFLPSPLGAMEVRHRDGNGHNNRATNLRWGTRSENALDKWQHGTMPHGERHANSVLTPEQVLAIRAAEGTYGGIARAYGVSAATVRDIRLGRTWAWLQEAPCTTP